MVPIEASSSDLRRNRVKSVGFFSDFVSVAKHMIVLHLDSSKGERCAVKFPKMF